MAPVGADATTAGSNDNTQSSNQRKDEEIEELMRAEFSKLGISPDPPETQGSRRRLLLVYIHGFMGSEESFRAFPAHVHNLLAIILQESHVVHSKIYPRYRSKQHIQVARDDFSRWLQPHETPTADIVLLGHSMGGLIAADIVLMPATDPRQGPFLHRILGTLNFDVPFLGMHPGVVRSGLASIFHPAKDPEDKYEKSDALSDAGLSQGSDQVLESNEQSFWQSQDTNFNAKFSNDVVLPVRKFWGNLSYFLNKHGRDVANAAQDAASSYVKFMSAMSNGKELRARYAKVRVLEEDDEKLRQSVAASRSHATPRVRFANYYTVSTGRPKSSKPRSQENPHDDVVEGQDAQRHAATDSFEVADSLKHISPKQIEAAGAAQADEAQLNEPSVDSKSTPAASDDDKKVSLPPFGPTLTTGRPSSSTSRRSASPAEDESSFQEPVKTGTFCTLPPKDSQGERDPTWIRMFMEDVDEVGAHCGMFFVDERYERFVGDVAGRVEDWVRNDLSLRAIEAALAVD